MRQPMNAEPNRRETWREALFNRRMLICVFTGFTSGLPLYLLFNLLPAWLRTEGVDLKVIGAVRADPASLTPGSSCGRRCWTATRCRCSAAGAAGCC